MVNINKHLQKSCSCASVKEAVQFAVKTFGKGEIGTLDYRLGFKNAEGVPVSPWHSIPLYAANGNLNFVCEIPRNTRAKYEVATNEVNNPIKQDSKKGKPRSYAIDILWNYGMLPQTWEDPTHASEDCDGHIGDNDPVDVVEIGDRTAESGEIYAVKPIAALAMIDEGELDWKVIAISSQDPRAELVNDVADLEEHFPGTLGSIREWFRTYKTHDGKPLNEFALGEEAMNKEYTLNVISQTHGFWKSLVSKSREDSGSVKLTVGSVEIPTRCFDPLKAKEISEGMEKMIEVLEAAVIQSSTSHKRHQEESDLELLPEQHDSKRVELVTA